MQETQREDYGLTRSFARAQRLLEIEKAIVRVAGKSTTKFYRERLFGALIDATWAARNHGRRIEARRYARLAVCERPHSLVAWRSLLSSIVPALGGGTPPYLE